MMSQREAKDILKINELEADFKTWDDQSKKFQILCWIDEIGNKYLSKKINEDIDQRFRVRWWNLMLFSPKNIKFFKHRKNFKLEIKDIFNIYLTEWINKRKLRFVEKLVPKHTKPFKFTWNF